MSKNGTWKADPLSPALDSGALAPRQFNVAQHLPRMLLTHGHKDKFPS